MSRVTPRPGSAEVAVILKMTSPTDPVPVWNRNDGIALYESRALTELVCQGLARRGWLDEVCDGSRTEYAVNAAGVREARKLRNNLDGSTGR